MGKPVTHRLPILPRNKMQLNYDKGIHHLSHVYNTYIESTQREKDMRLSLDGNGAVSVVGKFGESDKIQKAVEELIDSLGIEFTPHCHEENEEDNVSDWGCLYDKEEYLRDDIKSMWKFIKRRGD